MPNALPIRLDGFNLLLKGRVRIRYIKCLQFSCFQIQWIFGVDFVEASSGVEEDLPDVIHVSLPFVVEAALKFKMTFIEGTFTTRNDRETFVKLPTQSCTFI